jgi:hypothetical protein
VSATEVNTPAGPGVALATALLAAQVELSKVTVTKDATNPHYKSSYADLPSVIDAVIPVLNKHGIVVVQMPVAPQFENTLALSTTLIHAATGESLTGVFVVPLEKANAQGIGSAMTYACRYSLRGILNVKIAGEDDDGEGSVDQGKREETERKPRGVQSPTAPRPAPAWMKGKGQKAATVEAPKRGKAGIFPKVSQTEEPEGEGEAGSEDSN